MPHTLTVDFSRPIRLFPLAQCILLPHATIPLHIFEPRYRAMTRDALDSDGLIAMATFRSPRDPDTAPTLRKHVCVGYIVHHERLADGRYNLLLQGVARARIVEEHGLHRDGYRQAILRPTEPSVMEIDLETQRRQLEQLLEDRELQQLACIRNVRHWLSPELPTPTVVDLAWQAASRNSDQRYQALAEPCVFKRCSQLDRHLTRTRQTLSIARQMGPCTSETGLPLN